MVWREEGRGRFGEEGCHERECEGGSGSVARNPSSQGLRLDVGWCGGKKSGKELGSSGAMPH